jgi:hypothetical protein
VNELNVGTFQDDFDRKKYQYAEAQKSSYNDAIGFKLLIPQCLITIPICVRITGYSENNKSLSERILSEKS